MSLARCGVRHLGALVVLALIGSCGDSSNDSAFKASGGGGGEAGSKTSGGASNDAGARASGGEPSGEAGVGGTPSDAGAGSADGGASLEGGAGGAGGTVDPEREKCVASFTVDTEPNPDLGAVLEACPALTNYLFWVDAENE